MNRKIIIISPHFPPSNLAAVHRSRLFAQHLLSFGWEPIILTVHEKYYEEVLDHNLEKLLPAILRIEKVGALPVTKPRIIGDIGLRAFFQLYKRAKKIIKTEQIDFLYILIPSFYVSLLGRWLHRTTGVKYGVDYIDPWVHAFPGSEKVLSRHWFSTKIAAWLEPIAVKKASLITGVAEGYYRPVLDRNPHLLKIIHGAMPYGGEISDQAILKKLAIEPSLFKRTPGKMKLVYAGTMLPKAYEPLKEIFESIAANSDSFLNVEFHFVGSGKIGDDPNTFNIKPMAEKFGLWQTTIFEHPKRIPYLDVLVHLDQADGIFILGSTEAHYTPSKVYQGILSGKPIFAVLHKSSSAVTVLEESNGGVVLTFDGAAGLEDISLNFSQAFLRYRQFAETYSPQQVDETAFKEYSAATVTAQLAALINQAISVS